METLAKAYDSFRRVMVVSGIGPIISSAMVAAIGNGSAFSKGRDYSAWLGLVAKQMSTGDRTILGRISKRGNSYLRMLFIQAARVILLRPANWPKQGFGAWLGRGLQRPHPNVFVVALAKKRPPLASLGERATVAPRGRLRLIPESSSFPPRSASRNEEMEERSRQRVRDQGALMAFGAETRMRSSARGYPCWPGTQTFHQGPDTEAQAPRPPDHHFRLATRGRSIQKGHNPTYMQCAKS